MVQYLEVAFREWAGEGAAMVPMHGLTPPDGIPVLWLIAFFCRWAIWAILSEPAVHARSEGDFAAALSVRPESILKKAA